MSTRDPREAKLPKWAQGLVESLRRDLKQVREDFEEFADHATDEDTVVVVHPYAEHPKPVAREGDKVRFYLDGLDGYRWVDVAVDGRSLAVMASTGLRITPSVTNVLTLTLTRD